MASFTADPAWTGAAVLNSIGEAPENSVEEVHLDQCVSVDDDVLSAVAARCPGLERLSLVGCGRVTDKGIKNLAQACPELKEISLFGCPQVGGQGVVDLAQNCLMLEKLDLRELPDVDDDSLAHALQLLPDLKSISLCENKITGKALESIMQHCPNLEEIVLSFAYWIKRDDSLKLIRHYADNLKSLDLSYSRYVDDEFLRVIGDNCKSLTALDVSWNESITNNGMTSLSKLYKLQSLSVSGCGEVTTRGIQSILSACRELHTLNLQRCSSLTPDGIRAVCESGNALQVLDFGWATKVSSSDIAGLATEPATSTLVKLNLGMCKLIEDSAAETIASLTQLRDLSLHCCDRLSENAVLKIVRACTQLRHLSLSYVGSGVTDQVLAELKNNAKNIESLDLTKCTAFTGEALRDLFTGEGGNKITLRKLKLMGCHQLEYEDIRSTIKSQIQSVVQVDLTDCSRILHTDARRLQEEFPGAGLISQWLI